MNGVGFEILARTPVPKLPLSYTPPPPPPPPEVWLSNIKMTEDFLANASSGARKIGNVSIIIQSMILSMII